MAQVLGRYHIISELGRGGMGVVYKALDPKLERFIAIKCLSEELSEDEIVVARFLREARNVAALNHPNIAQIFVADEHEGKPYFVMEYVDGESLADFIDREGQCSPEMARRVTEQAAHALAAAAEEGIVHRDVKPGNIMLDRRARAVLTDFGIACVVAEQADSGSQTIMGTPGYLPPEALTGDPVDARGDMFSLGAVYYEMLTGERLMPGHDLKQTFAQLAKEGFPDLSALEGRFDERVLSILRKLLAVKPEDRYADWSALLADMAPLKTGRTEPVERSNSGPTTAEREVTAALATGRMQTAATATATASAPEATAVLEESSRTHHPVPVVQKKSGRAGRWLAIAAVLLVVLAAAGFGVARLDPSTWQRATAWLPGSSEDPGGPVTQSSESTASESQEAGDEAVSEGPDPATPSGAAAVARAGRAVIDESEDAAPEPTANETGDSDPNLSAVKDEEQMAQSDTAASDPDSAEAEAGVAEAVPESSEPVPESGSRDDDRSMAMADTESSDEATAPAEIRPEPAAAPPPRGVVVIGVGDPVIADPMVREIESALRSGNHPLIERSFVSGYRRYVEDEEVDLAGLSEPALEAGVRYVVVARALPAGERELQYYNRVETAYIAQLEAVTYDLHAMQQLGTSPVEQIEFTSLNATERAVQSVRPWLEGIRSQFD